MRQWAGVGFAIMLATVNNAELNGQQATAVAASATTSGAVLRSMAVKTVRPIYPEDALREHKSGVAVAEISISLKGTVTNVEILEAPSPSIGHAVERALQQWQFPPTDGKNGEIAVTLSGKMVFYFEMQGVRASVLLPSEVAYVGRWQSGSPKPNQLGHSQSQ